MVIQMVINPPKKRLLQFYYNTPWFIFVRVHSIFRDIYVHILGIILHYYCIFLCNNQFLPSRLLNVVSLHLKRTEVLVTMKLIRDEKFLLSVRTSVKVTMNCSSLSVSADDLVSNQLLCTLSSSFRTSGQWSSSSNPNFEVLNDSEI